MGYIITSVILGLIAILFIWAIAAYNGFIKLKNKIEEAFSTMDVYLKKRYDLIPNLVETVKGYAKHESVTLEKVIAARNTAVGAAGMDARIKADGELNSVLKTLFAVAESYPDLKANSNFLSLQNQLTSIETEIANSRKYYNGVVRLFNTALEVFPKNIIASMFRFTKRPLYEISDGERANVKVEF